MAVSGTGQGETPQSLAAPAFAGFSPIAESGTKAALTTGMTTDRKIFQSHKFCAIMVQNQISGYSAVGSALDLGSRGRAFESLYSDQMNEPLFSNIFIEKRVSSCLESLERARLFLFATFLYLFQNSQNAKLIFLCKVVI